MSSFLAVDNIKFYKPYALPGAHVWSYVIVTVQLETRYIIMVRSLINLLLKCLKQCMIKRKRLISIIGLPSSEMVTVHMSEIFSNGTKSNNKSINHQSPAFTTLELWFWSDTYTYYNICQYKKNIMLMCLGKLNTCTWNKHLWIIIV